MTFELLLHAWLAKFGVMCLNQLVPAGMLNGSERRRTGGITQCFDYYNSLMD